MCWMFRSPTWSHDSHPHLCSLWPQVSRDTATAQRDTLHQYTAQVAHDLASRELAVRGANREDALAGMHGDLEATHHVVSDLTQRLSIANDEISRLKGCVCVCFCVRVTHMLWIIVSGL